MAAVDPEAFAFVECDSRLADGSKGPKHFLCDVVREVDALDEEASRLKIEIDEDFVNGKFYSWVEEPAWSSGVKSWMVRTCF